MKALSTPRKKSGYTLVEALVASGILTGALAAASSLSMTTTRQSQMSRDRAAALHYAESVVRIWQTGNDHTGVLLTPRNYDGTAMVASASTLASTDLPTEGSGPVVSQGSLEKITVTVNYKPYYDTSKGAQPTASVALDAYRPASSHR